MKKCLCGATKVGDADVKMVTSSNPRSPLYHSTVMCGGTKESVQKQVLRKQMNPGRR